MNILSWQSLDNVWPGPQSGDWHWEKVIHNPLHLTHEYTLALAYFCNKRCNFVKRSSRMKWNKQSKHTRKFIVSSCLCFLNQIYSYPCLSCTFLYSGLLAWYACPHDSFIRQSNKFPWPRAFWIINFTKRV